MVTEEEQRQYGSETLDEDAQLRDSNTNCYVTDSPLSDPKLDRLKRWPFSQRVATTIASRVDPSSIVIGICGDWGYGKTTVLNFIESELKNYPQVICVWFNPWRFINEVYLLQSFFQTLAGAVGESISSKKEEIGKALEKYGDILSSFSLNIGVAQVSPGKIAKELGTTMSSVELDEIRKRIEQILRDGGKRIVILMDDIDRLDKTEVQTIFKLVKLTANFDYTTYVLAYEPKMVAASLAERYSSGDKEAGYRFLEKIVQIPLDVPSADTLSLRKICFEIVDQALKGANIELTEEHTRTFVRHFISGLEVRLKTPRLGKRYGNALTFSLPILKDEVNPVDLMLIEGIRVFYPMLYEVIKENSDVFLGTILDSPNKEEAKRRCLEIINEGLSGLDKAEGEAAKDLLQELFPRLKSVFSNIYYGSDWDERWAKEQHIASSQYFNRYFSYSVPEGDISDQELQYLLVEIRKESVSTVSSKIQHLIGDRNVDTFVLKLRQRAKELPSDISRNLSLAIAEIGKIFPKPEGAFSFRTPFSQAGMLVDELMHNIPRSEGRFDAAKEIVIRGKPITFAVECFRWLRTSEEKEAQDRLLTAEEENELAGIIVGRIRDLSHGRPIFVQFPEDTAHLLYLWSRYGSKEETSQYLMKMFKEDPMNTVKFLECYVPTAWGLESGLPRKDDFERREYDSVSEVVDTDSIYEILKNIYGPSIGAKDYSVASNYPIAERVAHQFAYIHNHVQAEKETKSKNESIDDCNN